MTVIQSPAAQPPDQAAKIGSVMAGGAAPGWGAFDAESVRAFAALYPETGGLVPHNLPADHPMFTASALADLADRLVLEGNVEYNRGVLPIGVDAATAEIDNGLSASETIRSIETNHSWAVLRQVQNDPEYGALLHVLLDQLKPTITDRTGTMLLPVAFIFLSSPNSVTPFHIDPEHNILMQIRGSKTFTLFPVNDEDIISHREHERYHTGGHRNVPYREGFEHKGHAFDLQPGTGVHVPVMAPHWVKNGPEVSVSLSITWRSEWSYAEADARGMNSILRKIGLNPAPPRRWPGQNHLKSLGYRGIRRLRGASVKVD